MTQGGISSHLISFAIPMCIGLLFQQLYNTVDTWVVGQFVSKYALAAVGSTTPITNMMVGLCNGLSVGSSVVISQSYGAHDKGRLHRAVHTCIAVTLILCALATLVGVLLVTPMLRMMNMDPEVWNDAHLYLTIYFTGISGVLIYNMGSAVLRAVGDSRRPLYFLVFSAITNTVLDLAFVIWFGMGVEGVALATVIAQLLSALLVIGVLTVEKSDYGIRWKQLVIDRDVLNSIFSIGLPSGIQQGITAFSNVFVMSYITAFGANSMAGYSCYNKLDAFILIPVQAIAQASTTFVGQNYGAGQLPRARKGVYTALKLSVTANVTLSVIVLLLARTLVGFFSPDPEVIDYGVRYLTMITPFYFTLCFNQVFAGALRGIGNAKTPTIIMLGSFVVFRQLYLAVTKAMGVGFVAVALAYPMGWVMASTLLTIFFRRSRLCREPQQAAG